MSIKKILKAILIIIMVLMVLSIITNNKNANKSETVKENIIKNGEVGIVSHKYNPSGIIEVIIKNNTGKELEYAKIKAECKDKNGIRLRDAANGEYNINTVDKYKIELYADNNTKTYNLTIDYKIKE